MDVLNMGSMDLKRFSELNGGRKLRDWSYYHYKNLATTAVTGQSEFFRVNGKQRDLSGASGTILDVSNMVTAGQFDEPSFITHVAVNYIPAAAAPADALADFNKVMNSGRLVIVVNNIEVFETSPLGKAGCSIGIAGFGACTASGTAIGSQYNVVKPHKLLAPIFAEENITFKAILEWTTALSLSTASWIGIELIGGKYFKN